MPGINIHAEDENTSLGEPQKRDRSPKLIFGLAVLIALPVIGITFSQQITVNTNTNNKVVFGQGQAAAAACDSDVVITPYAAFTTSGYCSLQSVTVTNLDTSSTGCKSDTLTVQAYDNATSTIASTLATVPINSSGAAGTPNALVTASVSPTNSTTSTLTITYASPPSLTTYDLRGFTIQQQ